MIITQSILDDLLDEISSRSEDQKRKDYNVNKTVIALIEDHDIAGNDDGHHKPDSKEKEARHAIQHRLENIDMIDVDYAPEEANAKVIDMSDEDYAPEDQSRQFEDSESNLESAEIAEMSNAKVLTTTKESPQQDKDISSLLESLNSLHQLYDEKSRRY